MNPETELSGIQLAVEFNQYDIAIVFPVDKQTNGFTEDGKPILQALHNAGMEMATYYSGQHDEIYVLLRPNMDRLAKFADAIDYRLILDPKTAQEALQEGNPPCGIKPVHINNDEEVREVTSLHPFQFIYSKYSVEPELQKLYYKPEDCSSIFHDSNKIKLMFLMIEGPVFKGGAHLSLRRLLEEKKILSYFPLHDESKLLKLKENWINFFAWPQNQPFEAIKDYYGEKIALYFKFLGHYTHWLMIPSVIGIAFQLVVIATQDFSHPVIPFFSVFIALWAIVMLEFWKRKEKFTALQWGMIGYEESEVDRPEFKGPTIKSYIDGSDMTFYSPKKYANNVRKSFSAIISLALIVLGAVVAIYVIRRVLYTTAIGQYAQLVASVMNSIQIAIFNIIYSKFADYLTDMENQRTDTEYEDSMIAKLFIFQFVNSYSSFFYIAYIARYVPNPGDDDDVLGECGYSDCMIPLAINLGIIFGVRLTVGNILELLEPWVNYFMRSYKETKGVTKPLSKAELQYQMDTYDQLKGSLNDYAELSIQFGYMTFFVAALPASTFGSFINNYVEIRSDAWKLLKTVRRPIPSGAEDIGTWMSIFQLIACICVMTNAGLIAFTMTTISHFSLAGRLWIFIGIQWFCFVMQFIIQAVIPDEPPKVRIQLLRQDFITDKLIRKVRDEEDEISPFRNTNVSLLIEEDAPGGF